jgi:hypothetical protein
VIKLLQFWAAKKKLHGGQFSKFTKSRWFQVGDFYFFPCESIYATKKKSQLRIQNDMKKVLKKHRFLRELLEIAFLILF